MSVLVDAVTSVVGDMYLCEWNSALLWQYYVLRRTRSGRVGPRLPLVGGRMTSSEEAERAAMIGIVFSGSLQRDQDRQLRGV